MTRRAKDEEREERITMEIVVDANGAEEQAIGWYLLYRRHPELPILPSSNGVEFYKSHSSV